MRPQRQVVLEPAALTAARIFADVRLALHGSPAFVKALGLQLQHAGLHLLPQCAFA